MIRNNLEIYEKNAEQWWAPNGEFLPLDGFNPPRFEFFDEYVADWQSLKVLDVGCGGGYTCEFMAKRGAVVSGVDISALSIQAGQEHAYQTGLQIDYRHSPAEKLPFPDTTFDIVTCVDVLEHVADLKKVISEIHRVLKPNGKFLFDTINRTFKSKMIMIWMLENVLRQVPRGLHDWKLFIKPEELMALMKSTGFTGLEIKGFDMRGKDKHTGNFNIVINNNTSVIYIGKAVKV